jgi:hypothetical protein
VRFKRSSLPEWPSPPRQPRNLFCRCGCPGSPAVRRQRGGLTCGSHTALRRFYLVIQPATTSMTITMIIVTSNLAPALFFPNLNVMPYHAHSGLCIQVASTITSLSRDARPHHETEAASEQVRLSQRRQNPFIIIEAIKLESSVREHTSR